MRPQNDISQAGANHQKSDSTKTVSKIKQKSSSQTGARDKEKNNLQKQNTIPGCGSRTKPAGTQILQVTLNSQKGNLTKIVSYNKKRRG